jgi:hypothetical protein
MLERRSERRDYSPRPALPVDGLANYLAAGRAISSIAAALR